MDNNDTKGTLIAIIDDDIHVRNGLSSLLRSVGYQTRLFESAEAFLAYSPLTEFHFLVVDIQLKVMNGIELHQSLCHNNIRIPTAFISGLAAVEFQHRLDHDFAQIFLSKPVDVGRLLHHIEQMLKLP